MVSKRRGPFGAKEEGTLREVYGKRRGEERGVRDEKWSVVSCAPPTHPPAKSTFK
jgi:hypothetical protein